VQFADAIDRWLLGETGKIEAEADLNVLLRQVVAVNQHLTELVGGVGVFALVGVVVL
jgi:hypothetical protein